MKSPHITVLGEASRWAPADHVDIKIAVVRRSRDSNDAVHQASEAYAALDQALRAHATVIVRRTTTSLGVAEITRWEPDTGRNIHEGFEATRTEAVRFAPIGMAGEALKAALGSAPDLLLRGPWFGLTPENEVHAVVRAAAASAALASAQAYVSGLGLRLGPVLSLREPGTGFVPEPDSEMMLYSRAAGGGEADTAGASMLGDLAEEDVEVKASVELVVTIT